jgi:polyvinyl alcohol dehydrogenase (cytochrome)
MRFSSSSSLLGRGACAAVLASLSLMACSSSDKGGAATPSGTGGSDGGGGGGASGGGGSAGGTAKSADWTMLAYDLTSNYWNKAETKISTTSVKGLTKAWDFDTQAGVTSTPVIAGGKVYVATQQGSFAIDLASGKQLWTNPDIGSSSSFAFEGGKLYLDDSGGVIRAVDAADGHELWSYKPDDTWPIVGFSSAVLTKDYVLVGASGLEEVGSSIKVPGAVAATRGYVLAVNKKDGKKAWQKYTVQAPNTGVGIWSTLSVDEAAGVVVAGTGNNYTGPAGDTADAFLAMKIDGTGDFLWKPQIFKNDVFPGGGGPDNDFGANPVLFEAGGKKLAAGGNKGGDFWVVDRADGTILKTRHLGPGSSFKGGIFVNGAWDGKSLLVAANQAKSTGPGSEGSAAALFSLDPLTLDVNWEREVGGSVWGPITVANGVGFFGKDKTLQAFDTATGEVLLEFPTEGSIATAPAISNGYVIFGSGMSWISATAGTKYYALKIP